MARNRYRSDLGIISDILSTAMDMGSEGTMISHISRRANLSNDIVTMKCERLKSAGLVESRDSKRNRIFVITEKGMRFFQQLQKFTEFLREAKVRY